ncbi:hypothetical protein FQZ97_968620 [compost metagenome]
MAVLTWVVMDVIHMPAKIFVIADAVFPESPLPDSPFSFAQAAFRCPLSIGKRAGELCLDQPPTPRVVSVSRWQGAQRVKVIGEDDDGVDAPGVALHAVAEAGPQEINVLREQTAAPVGHVEREEPGRAWGVVAAVVGH